MRNVEILNPLFGILNSLLYSKRLIRFSALSVQLSVSDSFERLESFERSFL